MDNVFNNLKLLKKDMECNGWGIDSFNFHYNNESYIVLVKLFEDGEKKPEYALLKLEFLKENDFTNNLLVFANSAKLLIETKKLREFFGIQYSENLGDILKQFSRHFAEFIPTEVIGNKTENQKIAMINSLSRSDSEDPRKIYCYAVRRNPVKNNGELGERSVYNDNKTRLCRETLYERLGSDDNLSFCYSMNSDEEKSDEAIIGNWTRNRNN